LPVRQPPPPTARYPHSCGEHYEVEPCSPGFTSPCARLSTGAGVVATVERLDHHTLLPRHRGAEERLALPLSRGHEAGIGGRPGGVEQARAAGRAFVRQGRPPRVEDSREKLAADRAACLGDPLPTESDHDVLEAGCPMLRLAPPNRRHPVAASITDRRRQLERTPRQGHHLGQARLTSLRFRVKSLHLHRRVQPGGARPRASIRRRPCLLGAHAILRPGAVDGQHREAGAATEADSAEAFTPSAIPPGA